MVIYDRNGAIRTHEAWANNPRILRRDERAQSPQPLINGPSVRPYIASKSAMQWQWREWQCPVGELYFSADELAYAAQHQPDVIIEPNMKPKASPNKDWGRHRWQELVTLMRAAGITPYQMGPAGTQLLQGAKLIDTPSFRHAAAVLTRARAAVLPEGGLHHAAAAVGLKSIVIFGGYISPKTTGYASQVNLFTGKSACGMRIACRHCAEAMSKITPQLVLDELQKVLA